MIRNIFLILFLGVLLNTINAQKNKLDLSVLYTPIIKLDGNELDTLLAIEYSIALKEFDEPIIYNNPKEIDYIRITWFKDTIPILYRIEKKNDDILLIKKKSFGSYFSNISDSVVSKTLRISSKTYKTIIKKLSSCNYWSMNLNTEMIPRNIIFESKINNEYYFVNKDELAIQKDKNYKKLFKLIKYLERLN